MRLVPNRLLLALAVTSLILAIPLVHAEEKPGAATPPSDERSRQESVTDSNPDFDADPNTTPEVDPNKDQLPAYPSAFVATDDPESHSGRLPSGRPTMRHVGPITGGHWNSSTLECWYPSWVDVDDLPLIRLIGSSSISYIGPSDDITLEALENDPAGDDLLYRYFKGHPITSSFYRDTGEVATQNPLADLSPDSTAEFVARLFVDRQYPTPNDELTIERDVPFYNDDSLENNDSTAQASTNFATSNGYIDPLVCKDDDYFKVTVASPYRRLRATLDFTHSWGDLDMQLRNSSGGVIETSNGSSNQEEIERTLAAGTYYLRVYRYSTSSNASINYYKLSVSRGVVEGSLTVTINPSDVRSAARWRLTTGPNTNWRESGSTISGITEGQYTLQFSNVQGWVAPESRTITIREGSNSETGEYRPLPGTVTLDPNPNELNASWTLDGPSGYRRTGSGDLTVSDRAYGNYTVTWGNVTGWRTPSSQTQYLPPGGSISFSGNYQRITGSLTVTIEPAEVRSDARWRLTSGPDTGWKSHGQTISNIPVSPPQYTLAFNDVSAWGTPSSRSLTISEGSNTESGTYLPNPRTVSGRITNSETGDGVDGVTVAFSNSGGNAQTSGGGYYSHSIPYGWSGTATPSYGVWTFDPGSRTYISVTANQPDQDYDGTGPPPCVISGRVTDSETGDGADGVTVAFSNGGGSTETTGGGYYTHSVPYGWSGTATPSYGDWTFDPNSRTYNNVTTNQAGQDYEGAGPPSPVISGRVTNSATDEGVAGVAVVFSDAGSTTTDGEGYYSHPVPYGWSGTATPSYGDWIFEPDSRSYSNVTEDQTDEDYAGTGEERRMISGHVTLIETDMGIYGVVITFAGDNSTETTATTDPNGFYTHWVDDGWSGTAMPSWSGTPSYTFNPDSREYTNVTEDQSDQDYSARFQNTDLCDAVDNCTLPWATDGEAAWFRQGEITHDGEDAAESGQIGDNQASALMAVVSGPGTVSFWWKVSSEADADALEFYCDDAGAGEPVYRISGEIDWEQRTYEIGEGAHALFWAYVKNGSGIAGSDCGWLDEVRFTPDGAGDINGDGVIDITDVILGLRMSVDLPITVGETEHPSPYADILGRADTNGDGVVDVSDVIVILQSSVE